MTIERKEFPHCLVVMLTGLVCEDSRPVFFFYFCTIYNVNYRFNKRGLNALFLFITINKLKIRKRKTTKF